MNQAGVLSWINVHKYSCCRGAIIDLALKLQWPYIYFGGKKNHVACNQNISIYHYLDIVLQNIIVSIDLKLEMHNVPFQPFSCYKLV